MWTFKDYDRELIWLSPRWAVAGSTHAHYGASTRQGAYLFQQRIELSVQGCAAALRCHTGQAFPRHHPLHRETSHPAGAEGGSEGTAQRPGAACPGPALPRPSQQSGEAHASPPLPESRGSEASFFFLFNSRAE